MEHWNYVDNSNNSYRGRFQVTEQRDATPAAAKPQDGVTAFVGWPLTKDYCCRLIGKWVFLFRRTQFESKKKISNERVWARLFLSRSLAAEYRSLNPPLIRLRFRSGGHLPSAEHPAVNVLIWVHFVRKPISHQRNATHRWVKSRGVEFSCVVWSIGATLSSLMEKFQNRRSRIRYSAPFPVILFRSCALYSN